MTATAMTGLVLAGGASSRMGRDKALLRIGGVRMVDAAVAVLRECCGEVFVAVRDRPLTDVDAVVIPDAAGEGPLAGIVAGLRRATTPLLAVLAVDMPFASAPVFRRLAEHWDGEAAVAPAVDGTVQPLHAVYATAYAEKFADLLAAGERSPRRALQALDATIVDAGAWSEGFGHNVNAPADLLRLQNPGSTGSH